MFAKLKKRIAEEAATAPRSGVRIPRTISKESITSVGADSGDDFASDGSSSRDDLPSQLLRRNYQIRKLEAKLSDYAEQLRVLQKTKEKLELALEKHQDSSIKKLQEQSDSHQASRAKMAEGMALALEKKEQEWMEKVEAVEKEKLALSERLDDMMEQSLSLFQKRDDLDELEGFQQQELAKVKHMLLRKEELLIQRERELQQKEAEAQAAHRRLSEARGKLQTVEQQHHESQRRTAELEQEREELLLLREEADGSIRELQSVVHKVSEDFQESQSMVSSLEKLLKDLQSRHDALKLQQQKAAVMEEEKQRVCMELQKKVSSLERRLQGNLSQDQHLQEILSEKSSLEQNLDESRTQLLTARTQHADTVASLQTQVSGMSSSIAELQILLRHKDDSSRLYRERTDAQIQNLEQQLSTTRDRLSSAEQQLADADKLQAECSAEKAFVDQQLLLLEQQSQENISRLQENMASLQTDRQTLQERTAALEKEVEELHSSLKQNTEELEHSRAELSSRLTVSTEIAKALEETRKQKEELQTRLSDVTSSLKASQEEVTRAAEGLTQRERDVTTLQNELRTRQLSLDELREDIHRLRALLEDTETDRDVQLSSLKAELLSQTQQLDACQGRISFLEVEVETLTEQLHRPELGPEDQNGSVSPDDLDHIQKVNRDLEQQLSDKNRIIKQLQQRLAELKRTLQKELKLKPDTEAETREKVAEGRAEKPEKVSPDPPPPATNQSPASSNNTVTNTSDLSDSREINFEYLKHVVLKFMSCREAEAFQLIRAVSVLLNFSREEEDLLKQTLEYKMSWFGSKPSPKGIVRPSISGSSAQWS